MRLSGVFFSVTFNPRREVKSERSKFEKLSKTSLELLVSHRLSRTLKWQIVFPKVFKGHGDPDSDTGGNLGWGPTTRCVWVDRQMSVANTGDAFRTLHTTSEILDVPTLKLGGLRRLNPSRGEARRQVNCLNLKQRDRTPGHQGTSPEPGVCGFGREGG